MRHSGTYCNLNAKISSVMCIQNDPNLTDYITALAAIIGVIFAGIGLTTWKKQLRGTSEYELAKKLMLQVYQLRNALQSTRHPFLSASEGNKDDTEETWEITAYSKRWESVQKVISDFDVTSLEAEVVWDDKTKQTKKDLLKLTHDLNFAIYMFVRQKRDKSFADDFHRTYEDTIYWTSDDDQYSKDLNKVVKEYETILKPFLKR